MANIGIIEVLLGMIFLLILIGYGVSRMIKKYSYHCPSCEKKIPREANICPYCGQKL